MRKLFLSPQYGLQIYEECFELKYKCSTIFLYYFISEIFISNFYAVINTVIMKCYSMKYIMNMQLTKYPCNINMCINLYKFYKAHIFLIYFFSVLSRDHEGHSNWVPLLFSFLYRFSRLNYVTDRVSLYTLGWTRIWYVDLPSLELTDICVSA